MTTHRDMRHQRRIMSPMSAPDVGLDCGLTLKILFMPRSHLVTAGDRSFHAAWRQIWDSPPSTVCTAPSLLSFKPQLIFFSRSYS
jgi:hypothetical protein